MSRRLRKIRGLGREERGATIVEFAIISGPLILLLFVATDFGYRSYLDSVLEGTLQRAARRATIGGVTTTDIDDYVKSQLTAFSNNATITITKSSYYMFANVGKPEKLITDKNGNGSYDTGDCYEDTNGNNRFDTDSGTPGLGGSDDIVYYNVSVTFPRLVPLGKMLGWSDTETVSANTVLRNQPYASQAVPKTVCN